MGSVTEEIKLLARKSQWDDNFFDGEEGLVAVFDFDYNLVAKFRKDLACVGMCS